MPACIICKTLEGDVKAYVVNPEVTGLHRCKHCM